MELPSDVKPIEHETKPPALPGTQTLPRVKPPSGSIQTLTTTTTTRTPTIVTTGTTKPPTPLEPQSPISSTVGDASKGIVAAPGRPLLADGTVAPVKPKKPTGYLRLVDPAADRPTTSAAKTAPVNISNIIKPPPLPMPTVAATKRLHVSGCGDSSRQASKWHHAAAAPLLGAHHHCSLAGQAIERLAAANSRGSGRAGFRLQAAATRLGSSDRACRGEAAATRLGPADHLHADRGQACHGFN
jgi:hypothetical protein